jgi:hypothetical protein
MCYDLLIILIITFSVPITLVLLKLLYIRNNKLLLVILFIIFLLISIFSYIEIFKIIFKLGV